MKGIFEERIIKVAFLFSLLAHCLFLGMPGFNLNSSQSKRPEEISIQIEIEKSSLLPKIDVMGEEKKLKEIVKKEKVFKPESQIRKKKNVEVEESKPKLEKEIEEIIEELKPELPGEVVEVINSQKEAMFRYQDMIKQRIESCRKYPNWAKKQGLEGIVYLTFIVLANGQIRDIEIIRSSEFEILNDEAVFTVKRASPFPPMPRKFNRLFLNMEVVIAFKLK